MKTHHGLFLVAANFCLVLFCVFFPLDAARAAAEEARSEMVVRASGDSVGVGVQTEFSTWSDLTALFRPSRWKNPFAAGGALSWLNAGAWRDAPGRTAKVLAGEAVVAGAITAGIIAASDGGGDDEPPPPDGHSGASYRAGAKR
jgi:hypothetical protein